MKLSVICSSVVLAATSVFAQSPPPLSVSGRVRVIDGDTMAVGGQRVRIAAIDACEIDQVGDRGGKIWQCGRIARSFLAQLIDGQHIECKVIDRDSYGRLVGHCFYQDRDVGLELLKSGMASTMFQYLPSNHKMPIQAYLEAQAEAKRGRAGIWSARIEEPSAYRRQQRFNHGND